MRRKKLIISFLFIALMFFVGKVSAYNYETTEVRLYSLRNNFKVCVKSPLLTTEHNLYIWSTFDSDRALQAWPGITMTQENDQIYCYTHNASDNVRYDFAIFNGNSKQTVDLNTINDSKGIINALLYKFDESGKNNDNKYVGAWHVYDTSKLVELVNTASSLDEKQYTIESYNRVKEAMGDKVSPSDVTLDNYNNYNLGAYYVSKLNDSNDILNKLVINYSDSENKYTAFYVDKYNELASALNQLEKRKDIVIDSNITGGVITASYNANSDTSITISANQNTGYRLKSITVSKIVSYDANNQPVLGESTNIDINNQPYTYSFQSTDSMVGVYVTGVFEKNKYKLTFQVGENGSISTMNGDEILSPVTVEYDDDYSLKVTANEGYKVNKILVDGVEYQLTNGVLTVKNVKKDTDVTITFSIKTFTIKYGTDEYTVNYGTTYSELLNIIDTSKTGYQLNYITDKNNTKLTETFVVTEDNELTGNYSKLTYKLTFQVGENGTISTMEGGEVLSPVTVEYDDNYSLKVTANEGYKVKKVLVDGVEYQLTNGVLTLNNVKKDTNVTISFVIKTYTIKYGNDEYTVNYGTTYNELLNIIDTSKTGYQLNYITDKNNTKLTETFIVTEDNELTGNYSKLKYKITFQVGENGTISTMDGGEVLSPVTVEYDDDYNLKITANEGYDINKILVDGVEYQLTNGVLTIKNIKKDTNVVITFSLKTYNVKIDDKNYSFAYGTSYEEILKSIDTNKDGYKFIGLKDKDGNLLDNKYTVKDNIELKTVYESIKKESNNPYTVDSIVKTVLIFVISTVLFTFVSYILLVKLKRKNG